MKEMVRYAVGCDSTVDRLRKIAFAEGAEAMRAKCEAIAHSRMRCWSDSNDGFLAAQGVANDIALLKDNGLVLADLMERRSDELLKS